jgi:hypothetical protein
MERTRLARAAVVACIAALVGCAERRTIPEREGAAADLRPTAWGANDCGRCEARVCDPEIRSCSTDPQCAAHLSCLLACGGVTSEDGARDIDAGCEAACPPVESAVGIRAIEALRACRLRGPGTYDCPDCGRLRCDHPLCKQVCPSLPPGDPCLRCRTMACCETESACEQQPACTDYIQCIRECFAISPGSLRCDAECDIRFPDGSLTYIQKRACNIAMCGDQCLTRIGPCEKCILKKCLNEYLGCEADADCQRGLYCGTFCDPGDGPCIDACKRRHPAGQVLSERVGLCTEQRCAVECKYYGGGRSLLAAP